MAGGKRSWTTDQEAAMSTRDKTLLVSAAAGSGKTATLTERIIRSILDDKDPVSIKDMLIVTFTNAAVGELRDRISDAIKKAARENPDNLRLEEELLTVRDAKIMTIDAFCNSILRSCAPSVGLPPNYRIADEAELSLLSGAIMNGLINSLYEDELPDIASSMDFSYLAECLTTARGEGNLSDVLLDLYSKTESAEAGVQALRPLIDEYDPCRFGRVDETRFGKYIIDEVKQAFSSYRRAYRLLDQMAIGDARDQKAYLKLIPDRDNIDRILAAGSFGELRQSVLDFSLASMQGLRGEKSCCYLRLECIRGFMKADLERFKENYFTYTEEQWKSLYGLLHRNLSMLSRIMEKFHELFLREKKRRGMCSYADIERYSYDALWKNGERTPYAKELAACFKAIYIDEYQDVNNLQNKIFEAVSTESNRFMVGDIKQSIYGFRSARPEIFADMKRRFPKLVDAESSSEASIFMSANFRCDKEIVSFTNEIFGKMFTAMGQSIGYVADDALVFSKIYGDGESPRGNVPEIHLIEKAPKNAAAYADENDTSITDDVLSEDQDAVNLAASEVAARIEELIKSGTKANGERFAPSDIAIILRSAKGRADSYRQALEARCIRASVADNSEFLKSEEVLLTLALLNSIDNPRRDIYLAALLMSPLFGFTPDELVLVRKCSSGEALYEAVCEYCGLHPDFKKGTYFLDRLNRYRGLAEGVSIDTLLSLLYRETGLLSLAERSGGKENLMLLQSYARSYESSSFKGLYSFISYINNIINEEKKFDTGAGSVEDGDTVKILTAHKSKGLEFPACFFAEAHLSMRKNSGDRIAYADNFGISLLLKDPSGTALVANPVQSVINRYNSDKEYEEELRILYVILTRAREALFIYSTASSVKYQEKLDSLKILGDELDGYLAGKFRSMFEIIEATRSSGSFFFHPLPSVETALSADEKAEYDLTDTATKYTESPEQIRKKADELLKRFGFIYPNQHLIKLPEKLSVSKLYPEILDGAEEGALSLGGLADIFGSKSDAPQEENTDFKPYLPKFITGVESDESARRGIATHTFMQFCDFDALAKNGADNELKRLIACQFLSSEDGERVRIGEIEDFMKSNLFTEMKDAKKLYRELRFNVKFPAEEFTSDEELKTLLHGEEILVQGVIDCIIEAHDGSLHLVDYKTDRLTRQELSDPAAAEKRLRSAHGLQLSYYKMAVMKLFGRLPKRVGIYSLHLGREIDAGL